MNISNRASWKTLTRIKLLAPLAFVVFSFCVVFAQSQPDVQVTDPIDLDPLTVEQGGVVTIIAEVSNRTAVPVTQNFDVFFQLEDTSGGTVRTLGADEVECLTSPNPADSSRCTISGLAAVGQEGSRVSIRAELSTGGIASDLVYNVIATAQITDANSTNNSGLGALNVTRRLPNVLVLAEFTLTPGSPRQGDVLNVAFTIENDRLADITVPFDISLSLRERVGDNQFGEFTELLPPALSCLDCSNIRLLSGERRTIEAQIASVLVDSGDYQLRVVIDSENVITDETNELDNILTFDFTLGQPLRNLSFSSSRATPQAARPGQSFALNFAVNNESFAAVENVELEILLRTVAQSGSASETVVSSFTCTPTSAFVVNGTNGSRNGCAEILRISAQQALELAAQFDSTGLAFGNYEWVVRIDPNNTIQETDEEDNSLIVLITLADQDPQPSRGPELHPVSLDLAPASPIVRGQKVVVSSLIKNSGNQDASNFRVQFSIRREDAGTTQGYQTLTSKTINSLKLGLSTEVRTTLDTSTLEPGLYAIKVEIISNQAELDGNNNSVIAFFTISAGQ